jgi:predicted AAA+ superfamily ATPase
MSDFLDQNPWWRKGNGLGNSLRDYDKAMIKWDPRIRYKFTYEDTVYTIRGPRQVGKTTLVKLIIKDLIDKDVPPRNIFYFDCQAEVDTPKELMTVISTFLDLPGIVKRKRRYIFLDEISSVRNWQSGIKRLHDKGSLTNSTVLLTGSHVLDIVKATERLPGRRGETRDVPDKIMVPMKFSEYVETIDDELKRLFAFGLRMEEVRREALLGLAKGKMSPQVKELRYHEDRLRKLLDSYLITGGLPKVVNDYHVTGEIPESTYRRYVDVVRGDLTRWEKREGYVRRILSRVIETLGSPISWTKLGEGADIPSHNTVPEYVDTLRDTFVLIYLYRLDTNSRSSAFEKEKKIYFGDPFFLHAMNAWVNGGDPFEETLRFLRKKENKSVLVEGVVADHMVRLAFQLSRQKQLFDYEKVLHYWKSSSQREVDFALTLPKSFLPIESKYKRTISRDDRYALADFSKVTGVKNEILVSESEFSPYKGGSIVPAWLFLLLI